MQKELPLFRVSVNDTVPTFQMDEVDQVEIISSINDHYVLKKDSEIIRINLISISSDFKEMVLKSDGVNYKIKIADHNDLTIERMGFGTSDDAQQTHIEAPMPGLVIEIKVKENQEVKEGDALLILEAMKMENAIRAPFDAVIKQVLVKEEQTVEKGAVMIEFST